jgi:hypothetical protein
MSAVAAAVNLNSTTLDQRASKNKYQKEKVSPSFSSTSSSLSSASSLPYSYMSSSPYSSPLKQQQQLSTATTATYNNHSNKNVNSIEDLNTFSNLSISAGAGANSRGVSSGGSMKNGYPTYQATVASVTSPSVANSLGTATAILSGVPSAPNYNTNAATSASASGYDFSKERREQTTPLVSSSVLCNDANRLDNFDMLNTVGTGTFGRVIVVKHKATKDYYALKIMSIAEVLRLKQTDHVKNEKQILQQVKHPFIINL